MTNASHWTVYLLALVAGCAQEPLPGTQPVETIGTVLPGENQPPVLLGADERTVQPGERVVLQVDATDADGFITGFVWVQTSGVEVELAGPTDFSSQITATFTAPGLLQGTLLAFQLTVADNEGAEASMDIAVTVLPNDVPVIELSGPVVVDPGEDATVLATVADDSDLGAVTWEQTAGTPLPFTVVGDTIDFIGPQTRTGSDITLVASVADVHGAQSSAELTLRLRGTIDLEIEATVERVVEHDFRTVQPDGFLTTLVPGDGVFRWERTSVDPARNITAPIARFLALAGYTTEAALGFEDMYLRTNADPTVPGNINAADLGSFLVGYDVLGDARFLHVATAAFDNAVAKYTYVDGFFPRLETPIHTFLWAYDAEYSLLGWHLADRHGIPGAADHLYTQAGWYADRYVDRAAASPDNAIFSNLIADSFAIGARNDDNLFDPEVLGLQGTAFAMMSDSVDAELGAEYLLLHIEDAENVAESVAEAVYALTLYLDR